MPTGVYVRTKEHRAKLRQIAIDRGIKPPQFGKMDKAAGWKGGRIKRGFYWYIKVDGHPLGGKQGYVAEHRLVMEKHIGRYLTRKEVVHHINHDPTDNRIENLELCSSPGQHVKEHHPEVAIGNGLRTRGKRLSPSTEFKKGQVPWNKGRAWPAEMRKKMGRPGRIPWNKGKTHRAVVSM